MKKSGIKFDDGSSQFKAGNILPIYTTATRPSNAKDGEAIINSTTQTIEYYSTGSTSWENGSGSGSGSTNPFYYSFNTLAKENDETTNYAGLDMDSIPTNFLTNNDDWFVAVRISTISLREDSLSAIVTGDVVLLV